MKKAVKKIVKKVVKRVVKKASGSKTVNIAEVFRSQLDETLKKNPDISSVGLESLASIGIPFKSFSQEILFHESNFPLCRMFCFDAMFGEFKSSLVFETITLWQRAGGFCMVVDTESKATPELCPSIVGYDRFKEVKYVAVSSFEAAQSACNEMIEKAKALYKTEGKCFPVLIALDSATGTSTDKENDAIHKAGHASIGYSQTANQTAKWIKTLKSDIADVPITFLVTRHCNEVDGPMPGFKIPVPKGCKEWYYQSYMNFLIRKGQKVELVEETGYVVNISVTRGANTGLRIPVRVMWHPEKVKLPSGVVAERQITRFDWDTATAKVLSDLKWCRVPLMYHKPLKEVLGAVSFEAGLVSNQRLGLKKVKPAELTEAIYDSSNADLLREVRSALGISVTYPFTADGGITFEQAKKLQSDHLDQLHNATKVDKSSAEVTVEAPLEVDDDDEYRDFAESLTV
jgi:hypothetical protein